ncbi:MAG: hypothetical protein KGK03_06565 [Candidatus Omnitrophica bacterium]|nr:hypothetical protein [Candidatus Omnitrophota bacterium]MDE2222715.1 hypothetical protein [Candidatus Omnitrophota bacterium]
MVKPQKHQEKIMHKITCADCGKEDSLPFKPAEGRPVYCKECFSLRRRGGGPTRAEDGYSNIAPTLSPVKQASKAPEAKPKKKPAAPAKKAAPKKKTTAKKK